MPRVLAALLVPLGVLIVTALGIVGIGSLLLAVGHGNAIPVALGLTAAICLICTFLARSR